MANFFWIQIKNCWGKPKGNNFGKSHAEANLARIGERVIGDF